MSRKFDEQKKKSTRLAIRRVQKKKKTYSVPYFTINSLTPCLPSQAITSSSIRGARPTSAPSARCRRGTSATPCSPASSCRCCWASSRRATSIRQSCASSLTFTSGRLGERASKRLAVVCGCRASRFGTMRRLILDVASIRVNLVCPGMTNTELLDPWGG
ncbi:hypothetical protein GGR52DRAFT_366241 [Hypoxylon sp. FL1284]|nr:hypothetical protein GGR52DRAFT_366241 [Hypoxylon sp. FL1284]